MNLFNITPMSGFHGLDLRLSELTLSVSTPIMLIITLVLITLSIFLGLYGYKIFKVLLVFIGIGVGAGMGYLMCTFFSGVEEKSIILIVLFCATCGGVLFYYFWWLGVFLWGSIIGIAIMFAFGVSARPVIAIAGIVVGVTAIVFQKFIIIFMTSCGGANGCVSGLSQFLLLMGIRNDSSGVVLCVTLALLVFFMLFQYGKIKSGDTDVLSALSPVLADEWWYVNPQTRKPVGPIPQDILIGWARDGRLDSRLLLWREGMAEWRSAKDIGLI